MREFDIGHVIVAVWYGLLYVLGVTKAQTTGSIAELVANQSVQLPYSEANPDREAVCTNETRTAEGLWCYQCEQSYTKVYDPENAVCLNNLSQVALRRCGPRDRYCKVERMDVHRNVMTIERGCVEDCFYGCRFNGYGLTQMRCTSCCRTPCCNDGNKANNVKVSPVFCLGMVLLIWTYIH